MLSIPDEILRDVLLTVVFRDIIRLSITSRDVNQMVARALQDTTWWSLKVLIDYPAATESSLSSSDEDSDRSENDVFENTNTPEEQYMLMVGGPVRGIEFALRYDRPGFLEYINATTSAFFYQPRFNAGRLSVILSPKDIMFLLSVKQHALIWRAADHSGQFPIDDLLSAGYDPVLLAGMFGDDKMDKSMIIMLLQSMKNTSASESLLRLLTAHPASGRADKILVILLRYLQSSEDIDAAIDGIVSRPDLDHKVLDSCLLVGVKHNVLKVVTRMLQEGADPNGPAFNIAVKHQDAASVHALSECPRFTHAVVARRSIDRTVGPLLTYVRSLVIAGKVKVV